MSSNSSKTALLTLTTTTAINVLSNAFRSLQGFVNRAEAPPIYSVRSNSNSVIWSYDVDMKQIANKYAEAELTAIIEELLLVGLELSEVTGKVRALKIVLVVDCEEVKKLEVLVERVKQVEVNIWKEINSHVQ